MITLTFVSKNQRSSPVDYDTDDVGEAMEQAVKKWFKTSGGPCPWWFAVIVERDGERLDPGVFINDLKDRASVEGMFAAQEMRARGE